MIPKQSSLGTVVSLLHHATRQELSTRYADCLNQITRIEDYQRNIALHPFPPFPASPRSSPPPFPHLPIFPSKIGVEPFFPSPHPTRQAFSLTQEVTGLRHVYLFLR
jgi:hypothetical protein